MWYDLQAAAIVMMHQVHLPDLLSAFVSFLFSDP